MSFGIVQGLQPGGRYAALGLTGSESFLFALSEKSAVSATETHFVLSRINEYRATYRARVTAKTQEGHIMRTTTTAVSATMAVAASLSLTSLVLATPIHAIPPNCQSVPWGFLGTQVRQICDGPIQPDGSWIRHRVEGYPAHYENPSSSCSGGAYYSNCTYYPGGYVADRYTDDETYPVTPETVLPDEPGHLGY